MIEEGEDPLGIGHWPKWKQLTVFFFAVIAFLGASDLIRHVVQNYFGSPQVRKIKGQIEPLAEQLEKAQKVGDKQVVVTLLDPTTKIVEDYNDLDEASQAKINQTALRYCVLAATHLSAGVVEVLQTGYWISKSQYEAAIDACK